MTRNFFKLASICLALGVLVSPSPVLAKSVSAVNADIYNTITKSTASTDAIRNFYLAQNYKPLWVGNKNAKRRNAFFAVLERAGDHGLPVARYRLDALKAAFSGSGRRKIIGKNELLATTSFLAYAQDLSSGVLNPSRIDSELAFDAPRRSHLGMLQTFAKNNPKAFFAALVPKHPEYRMLLNEKRRLELALGSGDWGPKVPVATLKPGSSSRNVAALRQRLQRLGYGRLGTSTAFDAQLATVVKQFQQDHGLNADGVAGPGTIKTMNISAQERLKQVLVNLERARWMNFTRGPRHVYVNVAAFQMSLIDNGNTSFTSRVVVGKTSKDRTPEFHDRMTHMVINPTWHVPRSIAGKEYLPILRQDPGFLARRGMYMLNSAGKKINPRNVNLSKYSEKNFPYSIKQRPDPRNALGLVKFIFPNRFNIYLHDTPSKSLFGKEVRAFSHGCVRVHKPFDFAYNLLSRQSANPEATFKGLLKTGREQYVDLKTPVPVYLSYNTAFFTPNGRPNYRSDVYGRDKKVFRALTKAGVVLRALQG